MDRIENFEVVLDLNDSNKLSSKLSDNLFVNSDIKIPFPNPKSTKFTFIDLFAGIGGFRLALNSLGGSCVYTSEWDKHAQITYATNFGEIPFGDITQNSIQEKIPDQFDVLCAGFPCQAFSIAGKQAGFQDTRGTLYFEIERIIGKHKPKVVFLENVKNLISHNKGSTFKTILNSLEKLLGYKVFYSVLNSSTHSNIPQNRERIFIIAFDPNQVNINDSFSFPNSIPLKLSVNDLLSHEKVNEEFYYSILKNPNYWETLDKEIQKKDTIYQLRRVYIRENKNQLCPTLTANMGTGGHNVPLIRDNYGIRKLTPNECLKFQGFPENYILPKISNTKLYMQIGNSVTVPLIKRVMEKILKYLE